MLKVLQKTLFKRALTGTGHPDLDSACQLCDLSALLPALLDVHVDWGGSAFRRVFTPEGTIRTYPRTHEYLGYVWYTIYMVVWWRIPRESGKIGVQRTDKHVRTNYTHSTHQLINISSLYYLTFSFFTIRAAGVVGSSGHPIPSSSFFANRQQINSRKTLFHRAIAHCLTEP